MMQLTIIFRDDLTQRKKSQGTCFFLPRCDEKPAWTIAKILYIPTAYYTWSAPDNIFKHVNSVCGSGNPQFAVAMGQSACSRISSRSSPPAFVCAPPPPPPPPAIIPCNPAQSINTLPGRPPLPRPVSVSQPHARTHLHIWRLSDPSASSAAVPRARCSAPPPQFYPRSSQQPLPPATPHRDRHHRPASVLAVRRPGRTVGPPWIRLRNTS